MPSNVMPRRSFLATPLALGAAALERRPQSVKTHVAVVGAGAFGGWTAWHLLRLGQRVTLIDAWGGGHARASSGGETRLIRAIYGRDGIYTAMAARALVLWKEYDQRWRTRLFRRTGALWTFSVEDGEVRDALPFMREHGLKVDELSSATARERFPQMRFDGVRSIFLEHEAGYLLARHACRTVVEMFRDGGGEYVQDHVNPPDATAPLKELRCQGGRRIAADVYVFACGPWLPTLFPSLLSARITPTRQEICYFGTPAGDARFTAEALPAWVDFGSRVMYGVPAVDVHPFKVADDSRGAPFDPTSGDRTMSTASVDVARTFLAERFPALADAPFLGGEVCQYENASDGHYIVDQVPTAANVWIVGGGSGHGFKMGPAIGELVAECVLGRKRPDPFFALARFAK